MSFLRVTLAPSQQCFEVPHVSGAHGFFDHRLTSCAQLMRAVVMFDLVLAASSQSWYAIGQDCATDRAADTGTQPPVEAVSQT